MTNIVKTTIKGTAVMTCDLDTKGRTLRWENAVIDTSVTHEGITVTMETQAGPLSKDVSITIAGLKEMSPELAQELVQIVMRRCIKCGMPLDPAQRVLLDKPVEEVEELDLNVRTASCLQQSGIVYVGQLVQQTEPALLRIKNFDKKCLRELGSSLRNMGLTLGMDVGDWTPPATPPPGA